MEYEWLEYELKHSPSLKLIRSDHVGFIVSFLVKQFKINQKISILKSELESSLESYLELLREREGELYPKAARDYLKDWCEAQYLRLTFEAGDEPIVSLTPETEKVISWLSDLEKKEFIGTESRFLQIVSLLKDIRNNTTTEPEERIRQLEAERDKIQREINQIKETGVIPLYNSTKLQEWFILANDLSQELIKDFTQIAENFRALARQVQEAQLEQTANKGEILSRVLDGDETLKNSDQGRSFYAFWSCLILPEAQKELRELIDRLYQLEELESYHQKYSQLRRLQSDLISRSQSIIKSNQTLAEKLRLVLDERFIKENRRVAELGNDIQRLILKHRSSFDWSSRVEEWLVWEGNCEINLMMERELDGLVAEEKPMLEWVQGDSSEFNQEDLEELSNQFYLDENELLKRINFCLELQSEVSLAEIVSLYPVKKGISEIIAYLSIASQNEQHLIIENREKLTIPSLEANGELDISLPQVIFRS
jgi:hypothetical protein